MSVVLELLCGADPESRSRKHGVPAATLPEWRKSGRGWLESRFWAVRVRPPHRDDQRSELHAEQWLLVEWRRDEEEATKYWLSTLPAETPLKKLVELTMHRWIVERDYLELKQELGLRHFEGGSWRGFHHHATLCIAAYGFLAAEGSRSPPPARGGRLKLGVPPQAEANRPRGGAGQRPLG